MDAMHFRKRAAEVRALARTTRDAEILSLLLDMASDLESEATNLEDGLPADSPRPILALRKTGTG